MKKLCILGFVILLTSCASIIDGRKATTVFYDRNCRVPVNLTVDGKTYSNMILPATVKVKRGFKPSEVIADAPGFKTSTIKIDKKFNLVTLWNILLGGIPGGAIDALTGAMMRPEFKEYNLNMAQFDAEAPRPATATNKQPADNSPLENQIINWSIYSSPNGCDVYWRVLSSTDEVKNTNRNYLGSTPYESTETFDIKGLTYENSGNVQIEVTCEKVGYLMQKKKFNLRQVIDQKDISTKFNLVAE